MRIATHLLRISFAGALRARARALALAATLAIALTLTCLGPAIGGPNQGGTLLLHRSDLIYSTDHGSFCGSSGLSRCEAANTRVDGTDVAVFYVIAAFTPGAETRLSGITFGIDHDPIDVLEFGGCGDFELAEGNWPETGSGTAVTWMAPATDALVEVYWFAGYNYYAPEARTFSLTPHPSQGGFFADDSVPAHLEPITGYGVLGFGTDGAVTCPPPPGPGACCFDDGHCEVTSYGLCVDAGGAFQPEDTSCDPNPCPRPGACCFDDGHCEVTSVGLCVESGGAFQSEDTSCDPNPCPQPGACCLTTGGCSFVPAGECSGDYLGDGIPCVPNPCPVSSGACCLVTGACSFVPAGECSGDYLGDGIPCVPNPCPVSSGACCLVTGACSFVPAAECSGDYLGDGIPCVPNPCPVECAPLRSEQVAHREAPVPKGDPFTAARGDRGPNAGGTLLLHYAESVVYTSDDDAYCGASGLGDCASAITRVDGQDPAIIAVFANFPAGSSPRVMGVTFGIEYDVCVVPLAVGACGEFELSDPEWPQSGSGTAVVWAAPQTDNLVEVYWFAAYSIIPDPQVLVLTPHPTQGGWFADDSTPAHLDPILAYGTMGFGTEGSAPCPIGTQPGACCFWDEGVCMVLLGADCESQGGIYQGNGTTCDPNPCVATPVSERTWGRIKHLFR